MSNNIKRFGGVQRFLNPYAKHYPLETIEKEDYRVKNLDNSQYCGIYVREIEDNGQPTKGCSPFWYIHWLKITKISVIVTKCYSLMHFYLESSPITDSGVLVALSQLVLLYYLNLFHWTKLNFIQVLFFIEMERECTPYMIKLLCPRLAFLRKLGNFKMGFHNIHLRITKPSKGYKVALL